MPWFYVDDGFSDSKPVMDIPDRHRLAVLIQLTVRATMKRHESTRTAQYRSLPTRLSRMKITAKRPHMTRPTPTQQGAKSKRRDCPELFMWPISVWTTHFMRLIVNV